MTHSHILELTRKQLILVLICACRELNGGVDLDPEDGGWDPQALVELFFGEFECTIELDDGRMAADVFSEYIDSQYLKIQPEGKSIGDVIGYHYRTEAEKAEGGEQ